MQKYLSIPVKNEANQLVLVNEIALVEQESKVNVQFIMFQVKNLKLNTL